MPPVALTDSADSLFPAHAQYRVFIQPVKTLTADLDFKDRPIFRLSLEQSDTMTEIRASIQVSLVRNSPHTSNTFTCLNFTFSIIFRNNNSHDTCSLDICAHLAGVQ